MWIALTFQQLLRNKKHRYPLNLRFPIAFWPSGLKQKRVQNCLKELSKRANSRIASQVSKGVNKDKLQSIRYKKWGYGSYAEQAGYFASENLNKQKRLWGEKLPEGDATDSAAQNPAKMFDQAAQQECSPIRIGVGKIWQKQLEFRLPSGSLSGQVSFESAIQPTTKRVGVNRCANKATFWSVLRVALALHDKNITQHSGKSKPKWLIVFFRLKLVYYKIK